MKPSLLTIFTVWFAMSGDVQAHWPDQPPHQMAQLGELKLERGGVIPNLKISYVTHGKLNAAKDNAILFLHGFGGNHHLIDHHIGPGRALDTDKYFIICSDALGATQTGYEHSTSPSNSGLKMKFPQYNHRDMVKAQYLLVTAGAGHSASAGRDRHLVGRRRHLAVRGELPGLHGRHHPAGRRRASATRELPRPVHESIIESCAGWNGGNYDENPKACATNAISVLMPYFYSRDWWEQHIDTPEAYQRWRTAMGRLLPRRAGRARSVVPEPCRSGTAGSATRRASTAT